jgi:hypothetical protein
MLVRRHLWLALLLTTLPMWSQVAPSATGDENTSDGDTQMATPPAVSGDAYSTELGVERRSNYLRVGLSAAGGYIDNLYAGGSGGQVNEGTYSILPTLSYDQTTPRQHRQFTYSPGFTFYQPTTGLNEIDQDAQLDFNYRLTPHTSMGMNDTFQKSSTAFGLPGSTDGSVVSGSFEALPPGIVAPFGERITNNARADVSFQFGEAGMVGASGTLMELRYPNPSEVSGLYNCDDRGSSGYYNRRITATQYVGADYQYSQSFAYPMNAQSETETHTVYAFYTIYPKHTFSISVSGGPQHYKVSQTSLPASSAWGPIVMASGGWQGLHTNVAASYSREVTGGGGLLGAFVSTSATASVRRQITRTWTMGGSASYAINKSVTPSLLFAAQEGHTIVGHATLNHTLTDRLGVNFEYNRLHQSYVGIGAISSNPDSDRETVSLSWQVSRPLGR